MQYVLDTNIISEAMKVSPNHNALWWLQDHAEQVLLNAISIEEIYLGIFLLPDGRRKKRLKDAIDAIAKDCKDRILPFDAFCGYLCAELQAHARKIGRPSTIEDCMIAAICKRNNAVLATHNVRDFDYLGIQVVDPFEYESETFNNLKKRESHDAS